METLEKYVLPDGNVLRIVPDDTCPENPHTNWDMVGEAYYAWRRNNFGGTEADGRILCMYDLLPQTSLPLYVLNEMDHARVDDDVSERVRERLVKAFNKYFVYRSVQIGRDGHICSSTGNGWEDNDDVLYVCPREKLKKEKLTRKAASRILDGELKTIGRYMEGNVFGFVIETPDGDHVDSCYGFYGDYDKWDEMGMGDYVGHVIASLEVYEE